MRILLAKNSGFCFGVRRAVELAEQAADPLHPVYTYGNIIHNEQVVSELAAKNVHAVRDISELKPGDKLIVRAHGAPPALYEEAETRALELVDATCPFVRRIHRIVGRDAADGRTVLIAGEAEHPEVAGIRGWAGENAVVLESAADILRVPKSARVSLVAQTTLSRGQYDAIAAAVKERFSDALVHETICDTTRARQEEAIRLARICTRIYVLGSASSANTQRLATLCKTYCARTETIDSVGKLLLDNLQSDDIIGIVAGASTPDRMIREVVQGMSELEKTTIETIEAAAPAEEIVGTPGTVDAESQPKETVTADSVKAAIADAAEDIREGAGKLFDTVAEKARKIIEDAGPLVREQTEKLADAFSDVKEDAEEALDKAKAAAPVVLDKNADVADDVKDGIVEAAAKVKSAVKKAAKKDDEESSEFAEAFEKTMTRIRGGQVITGTVISIVDGEVFVNIGYKSDGLIPKNEFSSDPEAKPDDLLKEGDSIDVEVIKVNDGDGNVLLSRKNVEGKKLWDELMQDTELEQKTFDAVGKEVVKGGVIADINGIRAFVPASQVSTKYIENLSEYVGKPMKLKVLEVDKDRKRIVASQKQVLLAEAASEKKKKWELLIVGSKVHGVVRRITDFGAFVDIGGIDGLVHVTDAAWGRVKHPSDVFAIGQEIEVLILNVDVDKERVSLGYKQLQPKPWTQADRKYPVGSIVEGKVVRIVPFGAFVALESTIDGLIHISQVDVRRVAKVEDAINVGDIVRCKVLDVNPEAKRISLSRKDAIIEENPEIAEKLAAEKAERDRQYAERQEQRSRERESTQQVTQQRRSERSTERTGGSSGDGERRDHRRRSEDGDYDLPPVQTTTTSLADLFKDLKTDD